MSGHRMKGREQRGQNHTIVRLDQCEETQSGDVLHQSSPLRAAFLDLKLYEEKEAQLIGL